MSKQDKVGSLKRTIIEYGRSIGVALIIALLIKNFIFSVTMVSGESMLPTLNDKDRLVISKIQYMLDIEKFERGDIVVLEAPDKDALYIKRIIGVPGDTVKIEKGKVYVNGNVLNENYIDKDTYTNSQAEGETIAVREGYYFVLGDNRGASKDSRILGSIARESIKGKAEFRLFPFKNVGSLG